MVSRIFEIIAFQCEMNSCNTTINAIWYLCLASGALLLLLCCSNLLELQCLCINVSEPGPYTNLNRMTEHDLLIYDNGSQDWQLPPYHQQPPVQISSTDHKIQIF